MIKKILIYGSFAYDTIMVYPGLFSEHILPESVHKLNISFMVPSLRREFGGCAANIAWNLQLLQPGCAIPVGTIGQEDAKPYFQRLDENNIDRRYLLELPKMWTAQAFITTDMKDNQITAFHPGAMEYSYRSTVPTEVTAELAVISPDGRRGMIEHAEQCYARKIPFLFDPGQGLPLFQREELQHFIQQADYLAVNDYEWHLLQRVSGYDIDTCLQYLQAVVVTRADEGSSIYTAEQEYIIPTVPVTQVIDPTGCGDAYRAGLLYGIAHKLDWGTSGRLGSLLASIKVAHSGTQNHAFTIETLQQDYKQQFHCDLELPHLQHGD